MASFTLTDVGRFPSGTSVGVYLAEARKDGQAPAGSVVTSGTMGASSVTFSGLADYREYVAYALVGGAHRYSGFRAQPDDERQYGVQGRLDALESGLDLAERRLGAVNVAQGSNKLIGDDSTDNTDRLQAWLEETDVDALY